MISKTNVALAAALILGTTSLASAGEGSPDLSAPWDYAATTYVAPEATASATPRVTRRAVRNPSGFAQQRTTDFSSRERVLLQREADWEDIN